MRKAEIGDWVRYECPRSLEVEYGFVLGFKSEEVIIHNTCSHRMVRRIYEGNIIRKMKPNDKLYKEELNLLIDLAIQTNDKEWLKELSIKLNVN